MGQQMQQGVLGGVKDPRVLNNKYLATLPSRILEIGDIVVLPDETLVLCGNTAPGWKEIHQIIRLTTVGNIRRNRLDVLQLERPPRPQVCWFAA